MADVLMLLKFYAMGYLSPQIEVLAKRKKLEEKSLVKKEYSCGIFQDYGNAGGEVGKKK